jgi:hypothetical protein
MVMGDSSDQYLSDVVTIITVSVPFIILLVLDDAFMFVC